MKDTDVEKDPSAVYRQTSMLEFPFMVTKARGGAAGGGGGRGFAHFLCLFRAV